MEQSPICVHSEVGRLKTVLLHRPGAELENLMPEYLTRQLFDDIPYLVHAREEHDRFAETLRGCGVEVLYLLDLAAEAMADPAVRRQVAESYVAGAGSAIRGAQERSVAYLLSLPVEEMLGRMAAGLRKSRLPGHTRTHLEDFVDDGYPFAADPMPNLYFTRDAFFCIGNTVCLSAMANAVRGRETLFGEAIFRYHPRFGCGQTPVYDARRAGFSIEGGDVLVLSRDTVAVGVSERTDPRGLETLAERLTGGEGGVSRVLAIDVPKTRAYMHLDTVMTMVDRDKFVVHPAVVPALRSFLLERTETEMHITEQDRPLDEVLAALLSVPRVELIGCGGGSAVDAAREQWNDGANTLCIAPGEVVTFSRNYVTNRVLRERGVIVHEIPSAELSRGRGGPRCMSMPFVREELEP